MNAETTSRAAPARNGGLIWVSTHARRRWKQRATFTRADLRAAWWDAVPVHYPSARDGAIARYHVREDLVLLARCGELMTCIDLADRPRSEQQYVRSQAGDI